MSTSFEKSGPSFRILLRNLRLDEVSVIDSQKVKAKRVVGKGCVEVDRTGAVVA